MKACLRLVLWLLLSLSAGLLFGEDAPLRLSGEALQIPDNWAFHYDPPEVKLRVKADSDSTLSLVGVLDGKNELIPLIAEYLESFRYVAQQDTASAVQELDVILSLQQAAQTQEDKIGDAELLAAIETWISDRKRDYSPREPSAGVPYQYRAGFFTYSHNIDNQAFSIDSFEQMHSYLGSAIYESNFSLFHGLQDTGTTRIYTDLRYPYHVTITDLQVGMGDYEHRFARGSLKKNDLFGVKDLYLDFDFLGQSGYWLEQNSSRSALKALLSVPLESSSLELEYASYSGELAMTQMRPEYWQVAGYSIKHSYRQYRTLWKWWFNLALLGSNETLKSAAFSNTLHDDIFRLQVYDHIDIGALHLFGLYERNFLQGERELEHGAYSQLARLDLSYTTNLLEADANVKWYDFDYFKLDGTIKLHLGAIAVGPFVRLDLHDADPQTQISSIFTSGDYLYRQDIKEDSAYGLSAQLLKDSKSIVKITLGQKTITNTSNVPIPAGHKAERINIPQIFDNYYTSVSAVWDFKKDKWTLAWQPQITLQTVDEYQLEVPVLEYQSYLNISRDLGFGNELFAGFSLNGHSSYTMTTETDFETDTSALADIWAGVNISNRFEFMVSYKNITDGFLYATYPLPRSLHATLRWFYLN